MARNPSTWEGLELASGRYRITDKLGEGGMGFVYKAFDTKRKHNVVIKVPNAMVLQNKDDRKRFEREYRALRKLSHPNVVTIYEARKARQLGNIPYAVMQYLAGGDLSGRLSNDPAKLREWLPAVAKALDYVHQNGHVHRDVKPGNILFDAEGKAYLSDFGIIKIARDAQKQETNLTRFPIGTPEYMAPEIHKTDATFDGRIDQYALAVIVYQALAGRLPFRGSFGELVVAHAVEQPEPIANLHDDLQEALLRGLAKAPEDRFPSCEAFADAVLKNVPLPTAVENTASETRNVSADLTRRERISLSDELVVGIDIGCSYSSIAIADDAETWVIPTNRGSFRMPSVVCRERAQDGGRTLVGEEALEYGQCRRAILRKILTEDWDDDAILLFRSLKQLAETELGIGIEKAVITHPVFFNFPRREELAKAAEAAGFCVEGMVVNSTAAALAYADNNADRAAKETVLVYDLGGGTFDATLMEIEGSQFTAIATAGDVHLGGIDWDKRIFEYVADKFVDKFQVDPREDDSAAERLRQSAEVAKMALTARNVYKMHCEYDGNRMRLDLTREEFHWLTQDLVKRTLFTTRRMLKEASRTWEDITRILLVGGSTRMPMVSEALEAESGAVIDNSLSPDLATVQGAAIYGEVGKNHYRGYFHDVTSHDIGLLGREFSTGSPRRKILVPKGTQLPCSCTHELEFHSIQKKALFLLLEGGDASGRLASGLMSFWWDVGIQSPYIQVTINIDKQHNLEVLGFDPLADRTTAVFRRTRKFGDQQPHSALSRKAVDHLFPIFE